jgi:glycerol uptake facilitator-like aquaporin
VQSVGFRCRSTQPTYCSDTFSGIAPADVPAFIAAQLLGATAALMLLRWLFWPSRKAAAEGDEGV